MPEPHRQTRRRPQLNSPCDMLVFGGTGDLALHKLLPALFHLHRDGRLNPDMRILAVARNALSRADYQALAERRVRAQVARSDFDSIAWAGFAARLDYFAMDLSHTARSEEHTSELQSREN